MGKSRLIAEWLEQKGTTNDHDILVSHFISVHHPETASKLGILRSIFRQLEDTLRLEVENFGHAGAVSDLADQIAYTLGNDQPQNRRLIVAIDALDESVDRLDNLFTGKIGHGVFLILSTRGDKQRTDVTLKTLESAGVSHRRIQHLQLLPISEDAIWQWFRSVAPERPREEQLIHSLWQASEGIPLFAMYLLPDSQNQNCDEWIAQKTPQSFQAYASQELSILRNSQDPATATFLDLFFLLTVVRGPVGLVDVNRILGVNLNVHGADPRFRRWFTIQEHEARQVISFAHPRLARVFRSAGGSDEVRVIEAKLLKFCDVGNWLSDDGHPTIYVLEWGIDHLLEQQKHERALDLITQSKFISERLSCQNPEVLVRRTSSEMMKLAKVLPQNSKAQSWLAFWANNETNLHKIASDGSFGKTDTSSAFLQLVSDSGLATVMIGMRRLNSPI